jgi:16S rRNA processing protein RimM
LLVRAAPSGISAGEIPMGTIGRPHGISGELIFRPYHPGGFGIGNLPLPLTVTLGSPGEAMSLTIRSARKFADGFLVSFEGVASREDAARLTGRDLLIPRTALPPLGDAEFYVEDLVGCVVQDMQGNLIGIVTGIYWNGAHDVMSLDRDERMIPVVPEFLIAVDPSKRIATVNLHE